MSPLKSGKEAVQLQSRHWVIIDSLRPQTIIDGEGVIGKTSIYPSKTFSWQSGSLISSSIGAMRGHYNFINLATTKKFKAYIPKFKLSPAFALN